MSPTPPRTAELLLEALGADAELRDAVVGDLAEEFAIRAAYDGVRPARRWYWHEALRTAPHLLRAWARHLRARDVAQLAGVVLTSYVLLVALAALVAGFAYVVMTVLGIAPEPHRPAVTDSLRLALALPIGAVVAVTGGYIAALLGRRAPLVGSLALGAVWSCVFLGAAATVGGVPAWYRAAVPLVVLAGTAAGGLLRVHFASARLSRRGVAG
jgi:hypothetical protein